MHGYSPLDFDEKDPLKLFQAAWSHSDDVQYSRDDQYEADYLNFHAFLDMVGRNPDLANIAIPKIMSIIQTKLPRDVRNVIGRRPYIPFTSDRKEYRESARLMVKALDQLLAKGGFATMFILMDVMNILYGTAFMEPIPVFVNDVQRVVDPKAVLTPTGIQFLPFDPERDLKFVPVKRLRFRLNTYAPWEVRVDPYATGLNEASSCRYLIKVRITSRREITRNAMSGAYGPDFDFDAFDNATEVALQGGENRAYQILNALGLTTPAPEGDIGVLFRYESPQALGDRYIDVWNDQFVLFDRPNPFRIEKGGHGLINLSRSIHNIDPHTQASFWGNGEGKPLEPLQSALNDTLSLTMDNANFLQQGKTIYANGRGVSPEQLINQVGNKIGFDLKPGERIQDVFYEDRGQSLPPEHFTMQYLLSEYMDLTANSYGSQRGQREKGDATLGEVSMLNDAGNELQELNVRLLEEVFMADFGSKCLHHIDQFARKQDKVELLGEQDAQELIFMNPRDIPGGFNFTFEGSDKIVNKAIRQNSLIKLDKRISQSPIVNERGWLTTLLRAHDLDDDLEDVLISEEQEMMQNIAIQRQAEIADQSGPQTTGTQAQDNGRQMTQMAAQ